MAAYLIRRLLLTIPILLGISLIVFLMLHTAGGDPAVLKLGQNATPENVARLRHEMGLDRPLAVQYLDFLWHAIQGDLGRSYRSNAPVLDDIVTRFPATVELAVAAMLIALVIGFTAGTIAGTRKHSFFDYSSTFVALLGVSIPTFWLGLIFIIVFGVWLRWLPLSGRVDPRLGVDPSSNFVVLEALIRGNWTVFKDALEHLILPAVTLAGWPAAIVARMTRASLIEVLGQEYIRTARAKGLSERMIVWRHAYRNALIPVITVIGLEFGALLGGAVVTETVFAWPGIGRRSVEAILQRDYQVVQGIVLLLGVIFVALNLLTDLIYALLDPRIRYR
ncbi:MAG TPA: ABC transporter permease [Thermomicrobiales bacterium]